MMNARLSKRVLIILFILGWSQAAWAHVEGGQAAGFVTGLQHPWSGLDHVLAMIAVGLWGAQLGSPALWLLPIAFPVMMAVGAMMGLVGIPVPGVEIGIALGLVHRLPAGRLALRGAGTFIAAMGVFFLWRSLT